MSANDKQLGGDHYSKYNYQPWDFLIDCDVPHLLAAAIEYVIRWKDKNGVLDLEKASHHLEKAIEVNQRMPPFNASLLDELLPQFSRPEAMIVRMIMNNRSDTARRLISNIIVNESLGVRRI